MFPQRTVNTVLAFVAVSVSLSQSYGYVRLAQFFAVFLLYEKMYKLRKELLTFEARSNK